MGKQGKIPQIAEGTLQGGNIRKDPFEDPSAVSLTTAAGIRTAVIFWLAAIGYMCLIFYISSLSRIPGFPGNSDKLVHLAAYVPLGFLLYLSLKKSGLNRYVLIIAFLIAGIYGITDEFHQYFVPGRDSSAGDVAADFAGAFLGSYGVRFFRG